MLKGGRWCKRGGAFFLEGKGPLNPLALPPTHKSTKIRFARGILETDLYIKLIYIINQITYE